MPQRNLERRWYQNDQQFRAQQEIGTKAEDLVLARLLAAGLPAIAGERGFRKRLEDRYLWENQADITVAGRFRIEVKSSRHMFINPGDWPAERVDIDPVWKFNKKQPRPLAYVFHSRPMGGLLTVGCRPSRLEVQRDRKDVLRKTIDDWYVTHPQWLQPLDDLLNVLMRELER